MDSGRRAIISRLQLGARMTSYAVFSFCLQGDIQAMLPTQCIECTHHSILKVNMTILE